MDNQEDVGSLCRGRDIGCVQRLRLIYPIYLCGFALDIKKGSTGGLGEKTGKERNIRHQRI